MWRVEPQKPQNSIRKPLECGNSNAGFASRWPGLLWSGPQDHRMSMFSVTQPSRLSFHATFVSRKSQMALIQILAQKTSRNSKKHVCISVCELHIVSSQPPPPITYTVCALSAGVCVCVCACWGLENIAA